MPTLGIAPLLDAYFRRRFAAAGLVEASVPLDGGATTVHCWRFQPGAIDARPVLVLLHGFGPPATWQWRRQVGPLSRRFRLIVPDLLFFGGSSTAGELPPAAGGELLGPGAHRRALVLPLHVLPPKTEKRRGEERGRREEKIEEYDMWVRLRRVK